MKLSIAWIFDHIDADWRSIDIDMLLELFNKTTAEIEAYKKITIPFQDYYLVKTQTIEKDITVFIPELNQSVQLSHRQNCNVGDFYFIKKNKNSYSWASFADFYCEKDGLVSSVSCSDDQVKGGWRDLVENDDYIIEVDNKSITHRPDMWGHRGFAREIAVMLNLPLKPFNNFLVKQPIKNSKNSISSDNFSLELQNPGVTNKIATLSIESIKNSSSDMIMALRLLRVDSRPIDFIVDCTNFVMLDIGQPMHTFDLEKIDGKKLVARNAKEGEKLVLLDDQEIELCKKDCVIADGKKVLSLAGIMGGKFSGISKGTENIVLESAHFDATVIRHSTIAYKQRTEASARFEKTLDPNQNVYAIERFLKLLQNYNVSYKVSENILSLGFTVEPLKITLSHDLIEKHIGTTIEQSFVLDILQKLEFTVSHKDSVYTIVVPTFRSSKDVTIKQDIIEEIVRFFGYDNIPYTLPTFKPKAVSLNHVNRIKKIKNFFAFGLQMQEVANYAFYDESFLETLQWKDSGLISAQNPVSENWKSLVTSLAPHLFKNIKDNRYHLDSLRFFEWGRIWKNKDTVIEKKALAGIFFEGKKNINFYDGKQELEKLFALLDMSVSWQQMTDTKNCPWYMPFQSAELICDNSVIGRAGKVHPQFLEKVTDGDAFMFELDGDALLLYKKADKKYLATSKYQSVSRDISMLVPLDLTVDFLASLIATTDERIISVDLVDFFQKKEWEDQKSVTMRLVLQDNFKTLVKQDVDQVYDAIVQILCQKGAQIR